MALLVSPDDEDRPWLERIRLLDDAPVGRGEPDVLGFSGLVQMMAGSLRDARGPMVVHVDGSWGRGKTSFCRLLETELEKGSSDGGAINTAWYIASDEGASAREALLKTVARAITDDDVEQTARIVRLWGSQAGEDALDFESFRRWTARELGWAKGKARAKSVELPVGEPAVVLGGASEGDEAESAGEGESSADEGSVASEEESEPAEPTLEDSSPRTWTLAIPETRRRRAVIFIDDLDRCRPERVQEVFDAVRSFVTCPGLMFVLAADREVIERAFEATVEQLGATGTRRAGEAMEKYIRHRVVLPTLAGFSNRLSEQLRTLQQQLVAGADDSLLRGPGTWLSDGVAVLLAQTFSHALTLRRLKRLLNTLIVELALAADQEGLGKARIEREFEAWRFQSVRSEGLQPLFGPASSVSAAHYPAYFVGRLIITTARFMWPELLEGISEGSEEFRERIVCLLAMGRQLGQWPERKLTRSLEELVPGSASGVVTPLSTRRSFCRFLERLYGSLETGVFMLSELSDEPQAQQNEQSEEDDDEEDESVSRSVMEHRPSPKAHVANRDDELLSYDFVPESSAPAKAPTPQQPQEIIKGVMSMRPREQVREADESPSTEQTLRLLHRELKQRLEPLPDAVTPEMLADLLNKADLLMSARLGHSGFDPSEVMAGIRRLVETTPLIHMTAAERYLLSLSITLRRWARWDDATMLTCALLSKGVVDETNYVAAVAHLIDDLCRPGALDPGASPLPLFEGAVSIDEAMKQWLALSSDEPSPRLAQAETLIERVRGSKYAMIERDVDAHLGRALAGFTRAIEDARLEVPRLVVESAVEYLNRYNAAFMDNPSPVAARPLVHILARSRNHDYKLLDRIYKLTRTSGDPELRLALANIYLESPVRGLHSRAFELYRKLKGTPLWTPAVLHNLATLQAAREAGHQMAGRYWELAYRAGYRDSRMLRAFSQFLKREGMLDVALVVDRGGSLRKDWHPFGEEPPQSEVHVPPEMNLQ